MSLPTFIPFALPTTYLAGGAASTQAMAIDATRGAVEALSAANVAALGARGGSATVPSGTFPLYSATSAAEGRTLSETSLSSGYSGFYARNTNTGDVGQCILNGGSVGGTFWAQAADRMFALLGQCGGGLGLGTLSNYPVYFGQNDLLVASLNTSAHLAMARRFLLAAGTATASATTVTLPNNGNQVAISGVATIKGIVTTGWQAGARVSLLATGAWEIEHSSGAPGANAVSIKLAGALNFLAASGDRLVLEYDGTNWLEVARTVA